MTTTNSSTRPVQSSERLFFSGMAIALAVVAFAGFAPSFYLRSDAYAGPPLTSLVIAHGSLATSWVLMLVVQTALVAGGQTRIHRKLGWLGAAIAASLVVVGPIVAIQAIKRGAVPPGLTPQQFFVLPMTDVTLLAGFVIAAILKRNDAQWHKRLMLLATIGIIDAATARLPGMLQAGPLAFFAIADLFIVAGVAYDLITRRKVHPAWIWGGLIIVVSQPLRLVLSGTPVWASFVHLMTGA